MTQRQRQRQEEEDGSDDRVDEAEDDAGHERRERAGDVDPGQHATPQG